MGDAGDRGAVRAIAKQATSQDASAGVSGERISTATTSSVSTIRLAAGANSDGLSSRTRSRNTSGAGSPLRAWRPCVLRILGLEWHTLSGHFRDSEPFWAAVGVEVPGGYQQREMCPIAVVEAGGGLAFGSCAASSFRFRPAPFCAHRRTTWTATGTAAPPSGCSGETRCSSYALALKVGLVASLIIGMALRYQASTIWPCRRPPAEQR